MPFTKTCWLLSAHLSELFQNTTSAPPQGTTLQFLLALALLAQGKTRRPPARPAGLVCQDSVPSASCGIPNPMPVSVSLGVAQLHLTQRFPRDGMCPAGMPNCYMRGAWIAFEVSAIARRASCRACHEELPRTIELLARMRCCHLE